HAVQIDADNQHDTNDIPGVLSLACQNPNAVITGQPLFDKSAPTGRKVARYLTHVWVWIETLSFTIRDSMCGFRVYPLDAVLRLANRTNIGRRMDFDSDILVRLFWAGLPVLSVPTVVTYPPDGESHFRMFYDNLLITRMHVRLVFGMLWRAPVLLARRAHARL
ncbi:MAG: glycosyltransferase family 2 protein, partial [Rhodospirillaceae bacterium]|nr:glycosyltransferase family 2 protein [Rhodospirillaceae bacterium]